jgi:hypothetical protein
MHFRHPYAASCRRRTVKELGGQLKDVMTVVASIQLREGAHDYDAANVNELTAAAIEYAKGKAFDVIEFEQGEVRPD